VDRLVIALMRYLAADAARSQRWLPPFLAYATFCLLNLALDGSNAGNALPTFAGAATALLPIAIWVAVVVGNCEDPVQATITVATVGSEARVRVAKLLVAYAGCAAMGVMSMAVAWLDTSNATFTDLGGLAEGVAAHLIAAATGVAVGAWCMRPVLDRRAWAVLIGVFVTLAEVLVPHFPPVRQLLVLFNEARPAHLAATVALVGTESLLIGVVLVAGAVRWGQSRT
jgi:hypothetical protein